jgi:hypothetical protein
MYELAGEVLPGAHFLEDFRYEKEQERIDEKDDGEDDVLSIAAEHGSNSHCTRGILDFIGGNCKASGSAAIDAACR